MHQPPRDQQQPSAVPLHSCPRHQSSQVSSPAAQAAIAPIPTSFARRKQAILAQLAVPDDEYTDLSPKGTVDAGIRDLIDEINGLDGLVTTSSCAGRVSIFLEGRRAGRGGPVAVDEGSLLLPGHHLAVEDGVAEDGLENQGQAEGEENGVDATADVTTARSTSSGGGGDAGREEPSAVASTSAGTFAGVGGKGGGGRWLFVSHEPVESSGKLDSGPNIVAALLGMEEPIFDGREGSSAEEMGESRLIHFKFEPMILHVLTASPQHAQLILRCGLQAGFRESGAINLIPPTTATREATATPMVAIRSMGLGLESLIGRETNGTKHCTVSVEYLRALVKIANERFAENTRRISRFRTYLKEATAGEKRKARKGDGGGEWESAEVRRERKRLEGLKRAEEARRVKEQQQKSEADS
ncbi:tRNA wybutosine-synthesizing protein [Diaporthe helianthi]|uniref:tRNA(Phe) 7-[(3-amino-3-carboxypropyl)-4-demethylwyosine(37)-N(4)]-methyltransferase n=1 Tax=Diaporthe helianthi TaxID=158607 RepID=A0A2P5HGE4_DIAHE|nr:tRNA wybutosine-synthesizing protein [Diaporthe helianthi]